MATILLSVSHRTPPLNLHQHVLAATWTMPSGLCCVPNTRQHHAFHRLLGSPCCAWCPCTHFSNSTNTATCLLFVDWQTVLQLPALTAAQQSWIHLQFAGVQAQPSLLAWTKMGQYSFSNWKQKASTGRNTHVQAQPAHNECKSNCWMRLPEVVLV